MCTWNCAPPTPGPLPRVTCTVSSPDSPTPISVGRRALIVPPRPCQPPHDTRPPIAMPPPGDANCLLIDAVRPVPYVSAAPNSTRPGIPPSAGAGVFNLAPPIDGDAGFFAWFALKPDRMPPAKNPAPPFGFAVL